MRRAPDRTEIRDRLQLRAERAQGTFGVPVVTVDDGRFPANSRLDLLPLD